MNFFSCYDQEPTFEVMSASMVDTFILIYGIHVRCIGRLKASDLIALIDEVSIHVRSIEFSLNTVLTQGLSGLLER